MPYGEEHDEGGKPEKSLPPNVQKAIETLQKGQRQRYNMPDAASFFAKTCVVFSGLIVLANFLMSCGNSETARFSQPPNPHIEKRFRGIWFQIKGNENLYLKLSDDGKHVAERRLKRKVIEYGKWEVASESEIIVMFADQPKRFEIVYEDHDNAQIQFLGPAPALDKPLGKSYFRAVNPPNAGDDYRGSDSYGRS